ncbi:MAG: Ig-like domain-containing protein [bacterium]
MKFLKLFVLAVLLMIGMAAIAEAGLPCSSIQESLIDSFTVVNTYGKPGTEVLMPLHMSNRRKVAGFQMFVDFDTTIFHPIITGVDTLWNTTHTEVLGINRFYDWQAGGRLNTALVFPQVFGETDYPSPIASHIRLKILAYPADFLNLRSGADTGRGDIIYIKVQIDPTAVHNAYTDVNFYTEDILDPETFPPEVIGCQHNNYADTLGISTRPKIFPGRIIVDTSNVLTPVVNSFTASPSTITSGSSSTLSWNVSNADSIYINNGINKVANPSGSTPVSPTSTTTYVLTAYGKNQNITAGTTVTVSIPGSNHVPVIASISPSSYTITEGENVAFSVSATDSDNDPITLKALSLPTNASFGTGGEVTGVGSASGNFSFTPNRGQAGVYNIQFQATDNQGGVSSSANVSITVEEIEFDVVYSTSSATGSPVGGIPGKKSILFPIDFVTALTVYGVQFDLHFDPDFIEIDSFITTPRTENFVIYDNIGETKGFVRVLTFGMDNDTITIDETENTAILYAAITIDSTAPPGDYEIDITDGWESVNPDPNFPSLMLVTEPGIVQVDRMGDINLDQRVDVADVVNIVGYILGNFSFSARQFDVADVVTNGTINVFDLVGIINNIFGIPISPAAPAYIEGGYATVNMDYDPINGNANEIIVKSELPEMIAGVEMDINYDPATILLGVPELTKDADGLTMKSKDDGQGKIKILMHFTNPFNEADLIQKGTAELVKIPVRARAEVAEGVEQIRLSEIMLSTNTGSAVRIGNQSLPETFELHQNYPNPFNPTTTIKFAIGQGQLGSLQHVSLDVFNILGQRVTTLVDQEMPSGQYEVVWDATNNQGKQVASGVYLYKLQIDDRKDTKKMLFIK